MPLPFCFCCQLLSVLFLMAYLLITPSLPIHILGLVLLYQQLSVLLPKKKQLSVFFFFFLLLQTIKEPLDMRFRNSSCNQASLVRMDSHASTNGSDDSSIKDWRKIVLEKMYQSLNETEGGLQECIRDALVFHPQGGCTSTIKVHVSP